MEIKFLNAIGIFSVKRMSTSNTTSTTVGVEVSANCQWRRVFTFFTWKLCPEEKGRDGHSKVKPFV